MEPEDRKDVPPKRKSSDDMTQTVQAKKLDFDDTVQELNANNPNPFPEAGPSSRAEAAAQSMDIQPQSALQMEDPEDLVCSPTRWEFSDDGMDSGSPSTEDDDERVSQKYERASRREALRNFFDNVSRHSRGCFRRLVKFVEGFPDQECEEATDMEFDDENHFPW